MMEEYQNLENMAGVEGSNDWVLAKLAERLKKVQADLGHSVEIEDPGVADDEDQAEAGEEIDTRRATSEVLDNEKQEILGAISWIEKHGDACAYPGCSNKVKVERRQAD